jgi:hypothetical protein
MLLVTLKGSDLSGSRAFIVSVHTDNMRSGTTDSIVMSGGVTIIFIAILSTLINISQILLTGNWIKPFAQ